MKKIEKNYSCPHCGKELPAELTDKIVKDGIIAKGQKYIAKVNASLTPEKRKKAAAMISPEDRRARAIKAAKARWDKKKKPAN